MRHFVALCAALALAAAACGSSTTESSAEQPSGSPTTNQAPVTVPSQPGQPVLAAPAADIAAIVGGHQELALELYRTLIAQDTGNVLLGPWSISQGLALPYLGARGSTAEDMASVLRYPLEGDSLHEAFRSLRAQLEGHQKEGLVLAVANRAFGQEGFAFTDSYLADLSRFYSAPLGIVDFAGAPEAARAEINEWTADQTNDRIDELFPPGTVDPKSRLALVNAVYLKADWYFPFNPEGTQARPFTLLDGSQIEVESMSFNEFLPSARADDWQAVQIPYTGADLSMIVIVPQDLAAFEGSLDLALLDQIRDTIRVGGIHLTLPKFELSYHASLVAPLQAMGLELPFGRAADFSGMNGSQDLWISAIEHETFVKVDENGTEAAAATGTMMADSHGPTIDVDKPFIFFIQDDATGTILFLGRVTNPLG